VASVVILTAVSFITSMVNLLAVTYQHDDQLVRLVEFAGGMDELEKIRFLRVTKRLDRMAAQIQEVQDFQSQQFLVSLPEPKSDQYGTMINDLVLVSAVQNFGYLSANFSADAGDFGETFAMAEESIANAAFAGYLLPGVAELALRTDMCWKPGTFGWCRKTADMMVVTFEDSELLSATYQHGRSSLLSSIAGLGDLERWRLKLLLDSGLVPAFSPSVEEVNPAFPAAFDWRTSLEQRKGPEIIAVWEGIFQDLSAGITYDQAVINCLMGDDAEDEIGSVFSPDTEPAPGDGDLFEGIECPPGTQPMIEVEVDTAEKEVSVVESECISILQ
jgi:hypothetical protein